MRDGHASQCKLCTDEAVKTHVKKYPERVAAHALRRYHANPRAQKLRTIKLLYKLSEIEYCQLCEKSGGCCAICRKTTKLVIDHDHTNGRVRGMLCGPCNIALGGFKDSASLLQAAITYLSK